VKCNKDFPDIVELPYETLRPPEAESAQSVSNEAALLSGLSSAAMRSTLNSRDEILLEPKDSMKRRGVARYRGRARLHVRLRVCDLAGARLGGSRRPPGADRVGPAAPESMMQPAGRLQAPRFYAEGWAKLRDDDAA
jgi:hypothetical protein